MIERHENQSLLIAVTSFKRWAVLGWRGGAFDAGVLDRENEPHLRSLMGQGAPSTAGLWVWEGAIEDFVEHDSDRWINAFDGVWRMAVLGDFARFGLVCPGTEPEGG